METSVHDFISVLNEFIDSRFPNTQRYQVAGGDYIKDVVIELRERNKCLRYSPYLLFLKSNQYEETIEQVMEQWETELLR